MIKPDMQFIHEKKTLSIPEINTSVGRRLMNLLKSYRTNDKVRHETNNHKRFEIFDLRFEIYWILIVADTSTTLSTSNADFNDQ